MKNNFTIELLDNGILIREDNGYTQAVLYRKNDTNYEMQFTDCYIELGKRILEGMFEHEGELTEESQDVYNKTGKPVMAFKVNQEITPITFKELIDLAK